MVVDRDYPPDVDLEVVDDLRASRRWRRGLKRPKIEEETTHFIVRWTRVASMAGRRVSDRFIEIVHPVDHVSVSSMKSAEVRQVLVARDPGPRARPL